jgi:hypothetical protein
MNMPKRERRDWGLIIFIIPIGIFLIVIVGQLAIGLFPNWRINADMGSNLDPNSAPGQPASLLQPLLPQILTPMAWAESYLTPGADISFPPFFVIEPTSTSTASPSPTPVSPTPTTATPTASATPSPTTTFTATPTSGGGGETSTATTPSPSPTTPSPSPTTPSPSPTPTGYPSTPDPTWTQVTPIPSDIEIGDPNSNHGSVGDGSYIVISLNVVVGSTADGNYDLVYYEYNNSGYVYLDWLIIGLSNFADGSSYFEVFNWGNGTPDTNSNVDTNNITPDSTCTSADAGYPECDNHEVVLNELYDPDNPDGSSVNQTGILIDVDTAISAPPPDTYNYVVIISPIGGSGDPAEIDAIDTVEVPIPP